MERFIKRFQNQRGVDIEEDSVDERNVLLRRLVVKKIKDLSDYFIAWKRET